MFKARIGAGVVAASFWMAGMAGPAQAVVSWDQVAAADATVTAASPALNVGTNTILTTGAGTRTYFRVDVPNPVTRAVLKIFPTADGLGSKIYLTSTSWSESAITWSNAPAQGRYVASTGRVKVGRWVEIDVTSAICPPPTLICNPGSVAFVMTDIGRGTTTYASREHWLLAGPRLRLTAA